VVFGVYVYGSRIKSFRMPITRKTMKDRRKYTDDDIINYSKEVLSIAGLLRKLNLKRVGGNYSNIKRNLKRLNVDTSHWTGPAWNKDCQLKNWSSYLKTSSVKPHLIKQRGHTCERCKLSIWMETLIVLEVHHIDGDRTNNAYENLQLLCLNCHALTEKWRGRKK